MSDKFERFVIESTKLQREALAEQAKISEDLNRQSVWFLGITTAAIGLIIVKFSDITEHTWVNTLCLEGKYYLIIIGIVLISSTILGALHQHFSVEERNFYRAQQMLFAAQGLIPFYKHPEYPTDEVPKDMHLRISEGELLNFDKVGKFKEYKTKGNKSRRKAEKLFVWQKALCAIGYISLFIIAIPSA